MNTISKLAFAPALAAAATFSLATPTLAGEKAETIVVTSPEKLKAWQADANRTLDRALEREPRRRNLNPSPGIVQLTFEVGADGRPANVEVLSSSANRAALRTAQHSLRWLGDISDVPVANADEARFVANIIFARSPAQHDQLTAQLEASERARLARGGEASEYIALGG